MMALVRKELRELVVPAAAVVALATIVLAGSLLYGRHHTASSALAAGIWLVASLLLAFVAGASTVAREPQARLVFVHAWPVSAACIWLAKALVSFVVTVVSLGLGFVICLSVADFTDADVVHSFGDPAMRGQIAGAAALAFACGLMWSGMIASTFLAAALGLLTAVAAVASLALYVGYYLPTYWGPYVGSFPASNGFMAALTLPLSALTLTAGAAAFVAYPPLELRRRAGRGVAVFAGLFVLLAAGLTVWQVAWNRPSPWQPVEKAYLADRGRSIMVETRPSLAGPGGFWRLPLSGGQPRPVARSGWGAEGYACDPHAADGPVVLSYQTNSATGLPVVWGANMGTGRICRLKSEPDSASPDGRLWAVAWRGQLAVQDERGRIVAKLGPDVRRGLIAPDSRRVYTEGKGTIAALDLQTGQRSVLTTLAGDALLSQVSPDGRFLVASTTHGAVGQLDDTLVLDLQTGRQQRFATTRALPYGLVDSRYQWCWHPRQPRGTLTVLDLQHAGVDHTVPLSFVSTGLPVVWHQPGLKHCLVTAERRVAPMQAASPPIPAQDVWLASPDGSGVRFLRQERREVLGLADDGAVVLWDPQRGFIRWDPLTKTEAVIHEARDAQLVPGGGA